MIELLIGIVGMVLIVVGFVLDEFWNKFNQNTVRYNIVNICGSLLLIYYAFSLNSWPFIILNVVWFLAALIKLVKIMKK
ncbi:MAG: hypothetical protein KKH52_03220 [Nanoarchaeota archaeon]|nr:hypothetical protein [Nanoarchaeota archaeon]MBU1622106.1 hypothetical protein [Nanoarchaeota archaeon]MBU1974378.1 hypothetical protein [Nanoarchaeota archaeon]